MKLETIGAKEIFVDRLQCMRDVASELDLSLDFLEAARSQCCSSSSGSSGELELSSFDLAGVDPEWDDTYTFVGLGSNGARVYAKDGDSVTVVDEVITGEGKIFFVVDMGSGYVYSLAESPQWEVVSPSNYAMASNTTNANPLLVPQPPDCSGWTGIYIEEIAPVFSNLSYE